MVESLRLVTSDQPEAPHRLLQDAPQIIERGGPDGDTYSITFMKAFAADELTAILSEPLRSFVPDFGAADVRTGIRSLMYPNSRTMKNVNLLDPHARSNLLVQRPQLQGLLEVIDHPKHHEMVPGRVHVFSHYLAELAAQAALTEMKPSDLRALCDEHGVSYDEMKMWRLKGGNRHNRPVPVDRFGIDADALAEAYMSQHFRPKIAIPGQAPVLIPAADLPNTQWARGPGYVELLRRITNPESKKFDDNTQNENAGANELGEHWEVLIRREGTPRHVVRPRIMWRTDITRHTYSWLDYDAEYHRQRYSWETPHKHLVFDDEPPTYNPFTHTIEHTSSILGPVMLAASVEPGSFQYVLNKLQQGKRYKPLHQPEYSRKTAGIFPALLQSPYVMAKILDAPAFRILEQLATTSRSESKI